MKREPAVVKDPAAAVQFGPPVIHPSVVNPTAVRTAAAMSARRGPSRYNVPVAGGPVPPIPHLEGQAADRLTMADQAIAQRVAQGAPVPPAQAKGGIFVEGATPPPAIQAAAGFTPPAKQGRPPLFPADVLPNEARSDPNFREGGGSMYASQQPELAYKYGVIRGTGTNKRHVMPQELAQPTKGLSDKTLADMERLSELQKSQAAATAPQDAQVEREAAAGIAGAAGRLGNAPGTGPEPSDPAKVEKALKNMDDLDFQALRDMMMKDIINNDDQRKIVEERCEPMKIEDMVTSGYVRQRVPIIPGKFEPTFQSPAIGDDLAIKRMIMLEAKGLEINERYLLDKFSLMTTVLGVYSINGNLLPSYRDDNGKFSEERFNEKYDFLARMSFHMLGTLGVHFFWFDIRVRRLFVTERLGNG